MEKIVFNQKELVDAIVVAAEKAEMKRTKKETKENLDLLREAIVTIVNENKGAEDTVEIKLGGGIVIGAKYMPARVGHNPATGESVEIPGRHKLYARFTDQIKNDLVEA